MLLLHIEGMPVPWKAHGGCGKRSFNPRFKEKEYVQWQVKSQFNRVQAITGPVFLDISYHMPVPPRTPKARTREMLSGKLHHLKRPDLDNLNKFLCDALKNIVYEDDSQIVAMHCRKIYGSDAKTVVRVEEVNA